MMPRILIVDDESVIRNFLMRVLIREGYEVQEASDGQEALEILQCAPFDLLLTDIKMDMLDGVGLLQHARQRYPDLAVILLTGHATVDSAIAALRHGAANYLLKPASNEEILEAVAAGLETRSRQQRRDQLEQIARQMSDVIQSRADDLPSTPPVITCGDLKLDANIYHASLYEEPLQLTLTEFRLLLELSRKPGVAFDYVKLVEAACGYTCARHEAQEIIGAHVRNLRRKIDVAPGEPYYVEAIRGLGYRLIW